MSDLSSTPFHSQPDYLKCLKNIKAAEANMERFDEYIDGLKTKQINESQRRRTAQIKAAIIKMQECYPEYSVKTPENSDICHKCDSSEDVDIDPDHTHGYCRLCLVQWRINEDNLRYACSIHIDGVPDYSPTKECKCTTLGAEFNTITEEWICTLCNNVVDIEGFQRRAEAKRYKSSNQNAVDIEGAKRAKRSAN